jgi:putative ABC transport system permease protein
VVTDYPKLMKLVKEKLPGLSYVVQRGRGWAKLVSDTASMQAGIGGIDITNEPEFAKVVQVVEGKLEDLSQHGAILIFEGQAKKLGVKVGDSLTFSAPTTRGINNTIDVHVVAIGKDIGLLSSWNTFLESGTLRKLYQMNDGATGALHVFLDDMKKIPQAQGQLREILEGAGYRVMDQDPRAFWMKFEKVNREDWTGQKLDVTTWEDEVSFMNWTLQALDGLTFVLIMILIFIVVIGIMNTMWIAIRERTREIGTLRAIGMQRGRVAWMFLLEAVMLGLGSTIAGALTAVLIGLAINVAHIGVPLGAQLFLMSDHISVLIQPAILVRAIVGISIVTTAAAVYPSLRAARLQPVTAMHHIG